MKGKKHLLYWICYLSYVSIYIARVNLTMASPVLLSTSLLSATQIGLLGSVFSVIYAVGRLANGILADRQPPWRMLFAGLALCGCANAVIGCLPPFWGFLLLWSVNAFAQSMLWSSILRTVSALYDPATAGKRASLMGTTVAVGNILGILAAGRCIVSFGLRWAFLIPGAITLVLAGAVLCTLRGVQPPAAPGGHPAMLPLLKTKSLRRMLLPALLHGIIKDNISLWMAVYVVDRYGVELDTSAAYVLLIPTVGLVGRLGFSLLYRLSKNRENLVSVGGLGLCILASVLLVLGMPTPFLAVVCLSLIYAAVSLVNTSFLSVFPMHFLREGAVASVSGMMDFVTYLGAGIGSVCYGFVIEHWGYGTMFASWAAVSALALVLLWSAERKGLQKNG